MTVCCRRAPFIHSLSSVHAPLPGLELSWRDLFSSLRRAKTPQMFLSQRTVGSASHNHFRAHGRRGARRQQTLQNSLGSLYLSSQQNDSALLSLDFLSIFAHSFNQPDSRFSNITHSALNIAANLLSREKPTDRWASI